MKFIREFLFFSIISCCWLASVHCQNYFTQSDIADGLVLPYEVQLLKGEDLFIKISRPVTGQTKCEFRSPGEDDVDVDTLTSNKFEKFDYFFRHFFLFE